MLMLLRASWTWLWACDGLGPGHQLIALAGQFVELALHLVEAVLELVHHLGLGRDARLGGLGLVLGAHLALQGHLGQVVELLGIADVALRPVFVGLARGCEGLFAPVLGVADVLVVVVLEHAQVADGLGHGGLGLRDVVRVVTDHLVQHFLRILGLVQQRIDVCLRQLRHAAENGLLNHGVTFRPAPLSH